MNRVHLIFSLFILISISNIKAQTGNVGIGTATPNNSAKLDITGTNAGLLIPRVALTATNVAGPITSPEPSLLVYNTATNGVAPNNVVPGYYYNAGSAANPNWVRLQTRANNDWTLANSTATPAEKADNQYVTGKVGIGDFSTSLPNYPLDVKGDIRSTNTIYANANNAKYFQGGDDAAFYDINGQNTVGIFGTQDSTIGSIKLGSTGGILSGKNNNIGVNALNPKSKLHIISSSNSDGLLLQNPTGGAGSTTNISFSTYTDIGGVNRPGAQISAIDASGYSANLIFNTKTGGADDSPLTEKMKISSGGVQIGPTGTNAGNIIKGFYHGKFNVGSNTADNCPLCVWNGYGSDALEIQIPWSSLGIPDGTNKTVMLMADGNNNSYSDNWSVTLQNMSNTRMDILIDRVNGGTWGLSTMRIHYIIINND